MERPKLLVAEESQSHQNRFERSKMLLGLGGHECCVMPYLVHRLIREIGGLDAGSDCITQLFWSSISGTKGLVSKPA